MMSDITGVFRNHGWRWFWRSLIKQGPQRELRPRKALNGSVIPIDKS